MTVDMAKKPRENRIPIMMSDEELTAVDDWRFENRVATRSDAIRRLCQIGMRADRSALDLFKLVRTVSDIEYLALTELARPDLHEDERRKIMAHMEQMPERAQMIIGALSLKKAVDAFRDGKSFEDAVEIAKEVEKDMALELHHALSSPDE